jgi:NADH-quinone oxidoreductase subunit N
MKILEYFPLETLSSAQTFEILPLLIVSFGSLFAFLVSPHKKQGHCLALWVSLFTIIAALIPLVSNLHGEEVKILGETFVFNSMTRTLALISMLFTFMAGLMIYGSDKKDGLLPEIYGLLLVSTAGMMMMMTSFHLLFIFISLEISSLAIYVVVTMRRQNSFSAEAGLKYFILGGLASAFFLYGSALIYGATGSFALSEIREFLTHSTSPSLLYFVGISLVVTAMFFKIGAFPFHSWLPDVYQGAASTTTGYMAAAVKLSAFLAFAHLAEYLIFNLPQPELKWVQGYITVVAVLSMLYGNFVAMMQEGFKRLLAYSSIAHSGYLLLGLFTLNVDKNIYSTLMIYLFFYALANLGAFALISKFEKIGEKDLSLNSLNGLGLKYPLEGSSLALFMLSMAGIPLTAGFIGKFNLLSSIVEKGQVYLVVIAVLASLIGVYYYLKVIVNLFMRPSLSHQDEPTISSFYGLNLMTIFSALVILQFGLFPNVILEFVEALTK